MSDSLFDALAEQLQVLFGPAISAAQDPYWLGLLLEQLGSAGDDAATQSLATALDAVSGVVTDIEAAAAKSSPSFGDIRQLLEQSGTALAAIRSLYDAQHVTAGVTGMARDLIDLLVGMWVAGGAPVLYRVLILLCLVDSPEDIVPTQPVVVAGQTVRNPVSLPRFHPEHLSPLLQAPVAFLRSQYLVNDLTTDADANAMADKILPRVRGLLRVLGVLCKYGLRAEERPMLGPAVPFVDHALTVWVEQQMAGATEDAGFLFAISPQARGDLGLVITPFGTVQYQDTFGSWGVEVNFTAEVEALAIGRRGTVIAASAQTTTLDADASATSSAPQPGPAFIVGPADGTRLEIGGAGFSVKLGVAEGKYSLGLSAEIASSAIVITPGDGDGFLQAVLPADGLRATFDLGLGYSTEGGLAFKGGAGLDVTLPLSLSVGGVVVLNGVHLGLSADAAGITAETSVVAALNIGPVRAVIDRMGIVALATFPDTGGNLGPVDLQLQFKPPSGVGLSIDMVGLTGSGVLVFDSAHGRYSGGLDVRVSGVCDLRLLGVLQSESTGSRPGFSLVLTGVASFPGIPIGLGFEINQGGALIAINRRLDSTAVTAALTAGTLGSVLDPGSNVVAAVTALERILPAADGVNVGGVMVGLAWGEPALAHIMLAFLYDTSSPAQLSVLGTVSVLLPQQSPLIKVHVDLAGRFSASPFAIDVLASLRDSTLAGMVLSGDAALQLHTGADALFVLALGGFHPAFTPPAGFPALHRLSLALPSNPLLQLSLSGYFAVTANTLQFGATLHFWAGIHDVLGVAGDASFDALISWDPLHFEAALNVDIHVQLAGQTLFGAKLKGALSGPGPWHIQGGVYVEVMWWEAKIYEVDHDFGASQALPPPSAVDPAAVLTNALQSTCNWTASAPNTAVLIAPNTTGALVISPAATPSMSQDRVPLGLLLDHIGAAPAGGTRMATLGTAAINGLPAATTPLTGSFAPAQFLNLSDHDALSSPSFDTMPAGLTLHAADAADPAAYARPDTVTFELIPTPPTTVPPAPPPGPLTWQITTPLLATRWQAPPQPVTLHRPTYAITSTLTLAPDETLTPPGGFTSRTLATQTLATADTATRQVTQTP